MVQVVTSISVSETGSLSAWSSLEASVFIWASLTSLWLGYGTEKIDEDDNKVTNDRQRNVQPTRQRSTASMAGNLRGLKAPSASKVARRDDAFLREALITDGILGERDDENH